MLLECVVDPRALLHRMLGLNHPLLVAASERHQTKKRGERMRKRPPENEPLSVTLAVPMAAHSIDHPTSHKTVECMAISTYKRNIFHSSRFHIPLMLPARLSALKSPHRIPFGAVSCKQPVRKTAVFLPVTPGHLKKISQPGALGNLPSPKAPKEKPPRLRSIFCRRIMEPIYSLNLLPQGSVF